MDVIIPAILETASESFEIKLKTITKLGVKRLQVDFCDGQFVTTKTLSVMEIPKIPKSIKAEAHLMLQAPQDFMPYKIQGFSKIILHYESFHSEQSLEEALEKITALGLEVAVAINPSTPVSVLRYFTDTISNFTILAVFPGKQGSSFIDETFNKIEELRRLSPRAIIEVDGGITPPLVAKLVNSGADLFVVGSGLFKDGQAETNLKNYRTALKQIKTNKINDTLADSTSA